jgi:hypothetical protein
MNHCKNPECEKEVHDNCLILRGGIIEYNGNKHRYITYAGGSELHFCNLVCFLKWIGYRQEEMCWITNKTHTL